MARFNPAQARINFGVKPKDRDGEIDSDDDLPTPRITPATVHTVVRIAGIKEATKALAVLPKQGETLHALCTNRMDLTDVIDVLLTKVQSPCLKISITTLGYNQKNLNAILRWLETGMAKRVTLCTSLFFRAHKGSLWEETQVEFRSRGMRAAACHSHAKVVTMHFADGSAMSIEGSANLCGNGSGREQFALFNDVGLADWHADWIDVMVTKHEGKEAAQSGIAQCGDAAQAD